MFRKLIAWTLCLCLAVSTAVAAPAAKASVADTAAPVAEATLFPKVNTYSGFSDTGTHWALSYIKLCYETDLMRGQGGGRFAPNVSISNAEIATLTARIHAAIYGGTLESDTTPWYTGAIDYLAALEIHTGSPNANATRQGFFDLLSAVVPGHMLLPINSIKALPDTDDPTVLKFYNAGILTGTDQFGTFDGEKPLTRGECAAMVARIIDPTLRRYFVPAGQVPADLFPNETVMVTVNGTEVLYGNFSKTMISLMEETQVFFRQYGLIFDWEENYGNENWSWNDFFKSATVHSAAAEVLATAKADELDCTVEDLAFTLFGKPTQAEMDAYALEHNISITSSNGTDALAQLVLEQKLNTKLGEWVNEAEVLTTDACEKLIPRDLWDTYTL